MYKLKLQQVPTELIPGALEYPENFKMLELAVKYDTLHKASLEYN